MQYFYISNKCKAKYSSDSDCTCWHDEGAGPYPAAIASDIDTTLGWRETPDAMDQVPKYEQALRDIKKHMELMAGDMAGQSAIYMIASKALEE